MDGVLSPYSVTLLRRSGLGSVTAGVNVACDDEHNVPQHRASGHPGPECYSETVACAGVLLETAPPRRHSTRSATAAFTR